MLLLALALAGLAPAEEASLPTPAAAESTTAGPVAAEPHNSSAGAKRVSAWIAATGDNHGHPYIIVDKAAARAFLFAPDGTRLRDAPVLIGRAYGDEATPAIGRKSLSEIGPAEKTTPAGRYLARFGRAVGHPVLWVDYATSVALHTIPPGKKEHRRARMLSRRIDDNRITFGCINVPDTFYKAVGPRFRKNGGYVYVLPDVKPLESVFPLLALYRAPAAAELANTPR